MCVLCAAVCVCLLCVCVCCVCVFVVCVCLFVIVCVCVCTRVCICCYVWVCFGGGSMWMWWRLLVPLFILRLEVKSTNNLPAAHVGTSVVWSVTFIVCSNLVVIGDNGIPTCNSFRCPWLSLGL